MVMKRNCPRTCTRSNAIGFVSLSVCLLCVATKIARSEYVVNTMVSRCNEIIERCYITKKTFFLLLKASRSYRALQIVTTPIDHTYG